MNSRKRIRNIITGETTDRCGFWLGNPTKDTWPLLYEYFGIHDQEAIRQLLGDDLQWVPAAFEGFPIPKKRASGLWTCFVHAVPDDVRRDVERVRDALGPRLIVSPSHEAVLPNVPPANILAMAEAATGIAMIYASYVCMRRSCLWSRVPILALMPKCGAARATSIATRILFLPARSCISCSYLSGPMGTVHARS